ncbi:MAG: precorrin-6Y C5,15-methyltransferase (decarboxylating) subunit CbiT [Bacillota bacterium]|nr:precorrin-6Y C5,15-methyltransferase (decarboxylating) subunit CbiT [Bacillota bacterium]
MTKEEVRAVIMAKANLGEADRVLDIGAGTGSLSIQAAKLVPKGHVYAIECNPEAISLIKINKKKFYTENISIIEGMAPEAMEGLPKVNVVFIGGSKGKMQEIVEACERILEVDGRIIITCVTLNTLHESITALSEKKFNLDITQLSVTKYNAINSHLMAKAHNPIFVILGEKEETNE